MNLLFSGIALMAGAAIWNKSPRSVMVDQTMKKPSSRGLIPAWLPVRPHPAFAVTTLPGWAGWQWVNHSLDDG